jgi:hypothetical protein
MYFDRNSGIGVIVLSNGDSEAGVDSIMLNLFEFAEAIITPFATPVGGKPVYFNIFPNPCRDEVRFLIAENYHSGNLLTIQSLQGQEVLTISTNGSSVTWDLRNKNGLHIRPGIYIVSLKTENGRPISAKKLIVIS